MFFDIFNQSSSLDCPYCGHRLTDLAPGEDPKKYDVFKAGFFSSGEMNLNCRHCGGKSGINIKRW